jgi:hypothetical protein
MLGSMMFEGGDIIRERIQRYQIVYFATNGMAVEQLQLGIAVALPVGFLLFQRFHLLMVHGHKQAAYQIQCDYRPGGLFVAMNHKQMETLEEQKANWERYAHTPGRR